MQYNEIPCNTMQYYELPCNTMQYHVIPYHAIPCTYQLIVADAADAVSVNFSGRCKFLQILRKKVAFFTDLTRKIGVLGCKFYSHKNCVSVKKMTIIRYVHRGSLDEVVNNPL